MYIFGHDIFRPKNERLDEGIKIPLSFASFSQVTELREGFSMTPVILKSCFVPEKLSMVRSLPTTSVRPKNFMAFSSVMTTENGWSSAVRASPYNRRKPYIGSNVLSPTWRPSRKCLSPKDT